MLKLLARKNVNVAAGSQMEGAKAKDRTID